MNTVSIHQIDPLHPHSFLIDVRTQAEFNSVHIPGSTSLPLERLDIETVRSSASNRPCYVLCQSGLRAQSAVKKLAEAGISACVVEGGLQAWIQAGKPVAYGSRRVLPLMRQVQTVAGLLALTGCALGVFGYPAGYGLAAFVGFGLTVAGLTGFCPMAMILARMPWNSAPATASPAAMKNQNRTCCGGF